eukprot:TRINITY_DN5270_c0_g1_i1.p1 TRINITY_DN5270_c0_g1~~TRINITY_DN5270_c0_g1_i1.p1  ORF type:complete len:603 (-),score=139.81 TRINITY_DN5270_c0_g1_i1:24-1832(-)
MIQELRTNGNFLRTKSSRMLRKSPRFARKPRAVEQSTKSNPEPQNDHNDIGLSPLHSPKIPKAKNEKKMNPPQQVLTPPISPIAAPPDVTDLPAQDEADIDFTSVSQVIGMLDDDESESDQSISVDKMSLSQMLTQLNNDLSSSSETEKESEEIPNTAGQKIGLNRPRNDTDAYNTDSEYPQMIEELSSMSSDESVADLLAEVDFIGRDMDIFEKEREMEEEDSPRSFPDAPDETDDETKANDMSSTEPQILALNVDVQIQSEFDDYENLISSRTDNFATELERITGECQDLISTPPDSAETTPVSPPDATETFIPTPGSPSSTHTGCLPSLKKSPRRNPASITATTNPKNQPTDIAEKVHAEKNANVSPSPRTTGRTTTPGTNAKNNNAPVTGNRRSIRRVLSLKPWKRQVVLDVSGDGIATVTMPMNSKRVAHFEIAEGASLFDIERQLQQLILGLIERRTGVPQEGTSTVPSDALDKFEQELESMGVLESTVASGGDTAKIRSEIRRSVSIQHLIADLQKQTGTSPPAKPVRKKSAVATGDPIQDEFDTMIAEEMRELGLNAEENDDDRELSSVYTDPLSHSGRRDLSSLKDQVKDLQM